MHVFEVLFEADIENPRVRGPLSDGSVEVSYPDGTKRTYSNLDDATKAVSDWEDIQARTRPNGRIEPKWSADSPNQVRTRGPGPSLTGNTRDEPVNPRRDPNLRADPNDRPRRPNDTATKRRSFIAGIWDRLKGAGKFQLAGKAGAIGALISTVLTAVDVEEELDRMLRVFDDEVRRQEAAGEEPTWTEAMEQARLDCIDKIVDLAVNGAVTALAGAAAGAGIWAIVGAIVGSGPVGWIAAIVGGGIIGFYGAEGIIKILEWTGLKDDMKEYVGGIVTPRFLLGYVDPENPANDELGLARTVDKIQGMIPGVTDDDPIGNFIGARPAAGESIQESDSSNQEEVMRKIQKAMKANPKLRQAYRDGQQFAKDVKARL